MVLGSRGCLMKAAAVAHGSCHVQEKLDVHIGDLEQRGRARPLVWYLEKGKLDE